MYNKQGWHDPEGGCYVLEEDLDDVLSGRKEPEPIVIRANAGKPFVLNLQICYLKRLVEMHFN